MGDILSSQLESSTDLTDKDRKYLIHLLSSIYDRDNNLSTRWYVGGVGCEARCETPICNY